MPCRTSLRSKLSILLIGYILSLVNGPEGLVGSCHGQWRRRCGKNGWRDQGTLKSSQASQVQSCPVDNMHHDGKHAYANLVDDKHEHVL